MGLRKYLAVAALAGSVMWAGAANAAWVLKGSWEVDDGPAWNSGGTNGPLAYTGREAAALLFGGVATDYRVSTDASAPNNLAYYAIYGTDAAGLFSHDNADKYLGLYYGPVSGPTGFVASAYVNDQLVGSKYTNYAFVWDDGAVVPEPATWALMIGGFGMAGGALRRRRQTAA